MTERAAVQATSSLKLGALLKAAISRAKLDQQVSVIAGLSQAAKALAAVALARAGRGTMLLIVPNDKDVEQITNDARFFYRAVEGATSKAVDCAILPFPSLQVDPYREMQPHFRVTSARARTLHAIAMGSARLVIASVAASLPRLNTPARIRRASLELKAGSKMEPQTLADLLVDAGFTREDPVDAHGEFSIRGGIVDIFPASDIEPVRIEFVGDMIETLRRYDPATQRSTGVTDQVSIVPLQERFNDEQATLSIIDFIARTNELRLSVSERKQVEEQGARTWDQLQKSYSAIANHDKTVVSPPSKLFVEWEGLNKSLSSALRFEELAVGESVSHVACQPAQEFRGRIADWVADIRKAHEAGETVLCLVATPGMVGRTVEILKEYDIVAVPAHQGEDTNAAVVIVGVGTLSRGFRLPAAALHIYTETDVFQQNQHAPNKHQRLTRTFLSGLRDLKVGDLVVHVEHGIGKFSGLKQLNVKPATTKTQEFLELHYAFDNKLFVPVERLDLIQKYTGGTRPTLDRLGGTTWEKAKTRVKKAMRDMAEELLKLYAQRKSISGHVFALDTHWQEEFESTFPYELTPDQVVAIAQIKKDMELPTPMDRLLCGDVGYGKTEVALRAAFKAVMDGKQVALLAPTTILAFQHYKTICDRFSGFPVVIEMISRFRSKKEQHAVITATDSGKVDILVGTHRMLSKDVQFRDLGLLVVDEEQRFGVVHKERIKQIRKSVDVLTMTATPIPRTLNMSLVGIRDMSIIETPPRDRLSIQTSVVKFDPLVIERAIKNELARGGQVYFVHNRVESIFSVGQLIQRLVPEARIVIGHGQMGEAKLERAMMGFVGRDYDILLTTTIIENGLDIPNANTMIINRADRYGLSQLYQLRGRVGRSDRPAYAYLLIPTQESLSSVARKRLAAIKEFSDLGSGFRVAALDLEIRGAGNLLGGEQSGHIEAVGFEMYMKLLEETIRGLKGEEIEDEVRAIVNLGVDLRIDEQYVPDMNQRLMMYRRVAAARTNAELNTTLTEIRDRYGPLPSSVSNLAEYGKIRIQADLLGVDTIDCEGQLVIIKFKTDAKVNPAQVVTVVKNWPGVSLVPPISIKLDLEAVANDPTVKQQKIQSPVHGEKSLAKKTRQHSTAGWRTKRATIGEVRPGFTKEAMLSQPDTDPNKEGGMFQQLSSLLHVLSK